MGHNEIAFKEIGEIRMGPPYYQLAINGRVVEKKVFFKDNIFDPEGKMMAITEYSQDEKSVLSILWIIELDSTKALEVSKLSNGVLSPVRFEASKLIYTKKKFGDVAFEYERDFSILEPKAFF